ncbi:unnamed protein product [Ambrosiozyma monospora]|nr:unnamed protein product [Ambrosiozyma monospora]
MDWFSEDGTDADDEITALFHALAPGGRVLLRSASQEPWYINNFEKLGFKCDPVAVRKSGTAIDRVNMYASTWVCTKTGRSRNMSTLQL